MKVRVLFPEARQTGAVADKYHLRPGLHFSEGAEGAHGEFQILFRSNAPNIDGDGRRFVRTPGLSQFGAALGGIEQVCIHAAPHDADVVDAPALQHGCGIRRWRQRAGSVVVDAPQDALGDSFHAREVIVFEIGLKIGVETRNHGNLTLSGGPDGGHAHQCFRGDVEDVRSELVENFQHLSRGAEPHPKPRVAGQWHGVHHVARKATRSSLLHRGGHKNAVSTALQTLTQGVECPRDAIDVWRKGVCNNEDPHGQENVMANSATGCSLQDGKGDEIDTASDEQLSKCVAM